MQLQFVQSRLKYFRPNSIFDQNAPTFQCSPKGWKKANIKWYICLNCAVGTKLEFFRITASICYISFKILSPEFNFRPECSNVSVFSKRLKGWYIIFGFWYCLLNITVIKVKSESIDELQQVKEDKRHIQLEKKNP